MWLCLRRFPVTVTSSPAGVSSTVTAINGVATFTGLIFNPAGTYILTAIASGLAPTTSNPLSIAAPVVSGACDELILSKFCSNKGIALGFSDKLLQLISFIFCSNKLIAFGLHDKNHQ